MQIVWRSSRDTFTASASAESETVSASTAIRHIGLPVQTLLQAMIGGRLVPIRVKVDNTQAISAIKKGYSKKLRCLNRTHRVSIGAVNEIYLDPECALDVEYEPTATHKGDFHTKVLGPAIYIAGRTRIGMIHRKT